jgi:hypothetical protein
MAKGSRELTAVEIKDFTLEQLRQIFEIRAADIDVFIGIGNGRFQLSSGVESACLNGAIVQINLETALLDDVMDDESFQRAFCVPQGDAV